MSICTYTICTVAVKGNLVGFQWDDYNLDKSYAKHGITHQEAEEVFLDDKLIELDDIKHSQVESRLNAIGKTHQGKLLLVVYTQRESLIRIISARTASKKERQIYEKA